MLIIGHRGAAGLAPENTMESLRAGVAAGVDILEFDIRLTKDNIPVVIHNATTTKTHNTRIVVAKHTLSELEAMELFPTIPTLEDVLDEFFGSILLNIELKVKGSATIVMDLLKRRYIKRKKDWHNILLSSFRAKELLRARAMSAHVPLAMLHDQNPFLFIAYERRLHLSAVGFHRLYVNRLAVEIAHRIGLFCYAYTVDRPYGAFILSSQTNIDGIVTNKPDIILSELKKSA
ncbi:glycerophosphodiester phosphodiesterase [Candidatus Saccharibacteria bacterium]|nr:glycerophosphodiester phosphodiesterase [Candidatus Saccharibacteria bacterium]